MSALQVADALGGMTGDSASDTLWNYLSDAADRTDQLLPEIAYVRRPLKPSYGYGVWPEYVDITDANAIQRTVQEDFLDMSERLLQLSKVAKTLFPGIRGLTEPESENLRSYYKKLFRKA